MRGSNGQIQRNVFQRNVVEFHVVLRSYPRMSQVEMESVISAQSLIGLSRPMSISSSAYTHS
jgi:hypothetical protein